MTTFDKMHSNKNEIFALFKGHYKPGFYDWKFTNSTVSSNHFLGDSKLLSGPFTISPTF